jgi:hypothetical protein
MKVYKPTQNDFVSQEMYWNLTQFGDPIAPTKYVEQESNYDPANE